jgi:hypothetical protein
MALLCSIVKDSITRRSVRKTQTKKPFAALAVNLRRMQAIAVAGHPTGHVQLKGDVYCMNSEIAEVQPTIHYLDCFAPFIGRWGRPAGARTKDG